MFRYVSVCIVMVFLLAIPCVVCAANNDGKESISKKPSPEKSDGSEAISEAISLLEDRKESVGDRKAQAQISAAIHALEKFLTRKEKVAEEKIATKELNKTALTKELKKKLRGKVAYNDKTKELTVAYDWASKRQLDDFDLSKAKAEIVRGSLALRPADSIRHIVDFEKVDIEVPVLVPQMRGTIIDTSSGIQISLGGGNCDRLFFSAGNEGADVIVPGHQRTGVQQVRLTVEQGRVTVTYGNGTPIKVGKPVVNCHAGQIALCGGDAGFQFGKLIFTGTIGDEGLTKLLSDSIPKK